MEKRIFNLRLLKILFQHCCACGSLTVRESHLCQKCSASILQSKQLIGFEAQYWRSILPKIRGLTLGVYSTPQLKAWVYALKNGGSSPDYRAIAIEWIQKRQKTYDVAMLTPTIIIPSPARLNRAKDHAFCLAQALSIETGWDLLDLLEFQNLEEAAQKYKGVQLRAQRTFRIKEPSEILAFYNTELPNTIKDLHYGTIIFIDDVVTTGSTAMAAWNALENPPHFEVWCMAIQPRQERGINVI